jgi:hypothetical protein
MAGWRVHPTTIGKEETDMGEEPLIARAMKRTEKSPAAEVDADRDDLLTEIASSEQVVRTDAIRELSRMPKGPIERRTWRESEFEAVTRWLDDTAMKVAKLEIEPETLGLSSEIWRAVERLKNLNIALRHVQAIIAQRSP